MIGCFRLNVNNPRAMEVQRMKNKSAMIVSVAFGLLLVAGLVYAHHSDSVFDQEKLVTLTGTVTRFVFANPHTQIYLEVEDGKGNVEEWVITGGALGSMRRVGWTHNTIKPGEILTISGFKYWDQRPIMIHVKLTRANGDEILPSQSEERRLAGFLGKVGVKTIETLPTNLHIRVN